MTSGALGTYGRRTASVMPEGKVSEFFYDADGHVQAKTKQIYVSGLPIAALLIIAKNALDQL